MPLTESTTLDEVKHDKTTSTVTVTWRDHLFRDGVEVDAARVARTKTYSADQAAEFAADVGSEAVNYSSLFN